MKANKANIVFIHNKNSKKENKIEILNEGRLNSQINTKEDAKINAKKKEVKKSSGLKNDNAKLRDLLEKALFSQLSDIKVKLLNFGEIIYAFTKELNNNNNKKNLPKIDYIELTLLNQNDSISKFKKYGYGIYLFFYYLKSVLVTFGILSFFSLYYIYNIFFKYYRDYEEEYSLIFDYDLLSVISGVQIIRFRNYYIEIYGKEVFLEKHKNFDVFYIEYFLAVFIIFGATLLMNLIFVIISLREYRKYKKNDIYNYNTLILSGSDEDDILEESEIEEIESSENNITKKEKKGEKKEKKMKIFTEQQIKEKIGFNKDNNDIEIQFTLKKSQYFEKIEELKELNEKQSIIEFRINRNKCCPHKICNITCCCFCGCCFTCNCCCCDKNKLENEKLKILDKKKEIEKSLKDIDKNEEKENKDTYRNPLYLITFKDKKAYEEVYNKYPSIYLWFKIKSCCRKKNTFFINKAPNPEDIAWENLEFPKGYKYITSKLVILGYFILHIFFSFVVQLMGEIVDSFLSEHIIYLFAINIIVSLILDKLDDIFSDMIRNKLKEKFKFWSYSDITFYSILYQTIFKFISKGAFPLLTYYLFNLAYRKLFNEENDSDYADLVSKMFIIIEMDGFGYPLIDWLFNIIPKLKNFYNSTQMILSPDNIEKEFSELINNEKGFSSLELEEAFEKEEMNLEDNYSDILSSYWITMFYFPIYPIGIIQTFLNLLFKYITEKNLIINVYKRPSYINPHFGFFCINYFNFGFFLYLLGNFIFFYNEDNKNSFDLIYILIMVLVFILPFFYVVAKIIVYMTELCCKYNSNINSEDKDLSPKIGYGLFNPYDQKEKIKNIFHNYYQLRVDGSPIIDENQYQEIIAKVENMENWDLYTLQEKFRTPKYMIFEERPLSWNLDYRYGTKIVTNEKKIEFYYLLMQLGFLTYYEIGNILKAKKIEFKNINSIRSESLKRLSIQENLTNSDSGNFTLYKKNDEYMLAYIDKGININILNIFNKTEKSIDDLCNNGKSIASINSFIFKGKQFLAIIALNNTMSIYDLEINKIIIRIGKIGDTFSEKNKLQLFSISSINMNDKKICIYTSYYYDKAFKIYEFNDLVDIPQNYQENDLISQKIQTKYNVKKVNNKGEYIISLEASFLAHGLYFTIVRTPTKIYIYVSDDEDPILGAQGEAFFNNFKILPLNLIEMNYYLVVTLIQHDLAVYSVILINLYKFFPSKAINYLYRVNNMKIPIQNNEVKIQQNEIVNQNNINELDDEYTSQFAVDLQGIDEVERKRRSKELLREDNYEKYNIGNVLLWEKDYFIIGTPFSYLHIFDYKRYIIIKSYKLIEPIGIIYNDEKGKENEGISNIITYNISDQIDDPQYGSCFIMRDNKGKLQYIRSSKAKDKLNYDIIQTNQDFDDFPDYIKLSRLKYSAKFYTFYYFINILSPLIGALIGHYEKKDINIKKLIKEEDFFYIIILYSIFALISFLLKGCLYDLSLKRSNCAKNLVYICLLVRTAGDVYICYLLCVKNKTVIYFIGALNIYFFSHIFFNYIVYWCKIKYLLRIYLIGFTFYQISRLCIILCFMIMISVNATNFEIYIYILVLIVVSGYMYFVSYNNTLQKEITYRNKCQALLNYPLEWMNLFCCLCTNSRECIRNTDQICCQSCDNCLIEKFPRCCLADNNKKEKPCICCYYCCCCCCCCCCCKESYEKCCNSIFEIEDYSY